jgi:hypothetical protein
MSEGSRRSSKSSKSSKSSNSSISSSKSESRRNRYDDIKSNIASMHKQTEQNNESDREKENEQREQREQREREQREQREREQREREQREREQREQKEQREQRKPDIVNYINDDDDYEQCTEAVKKIRRMEKFATLMYIKRSGCELSKNYSIASDYWEMCSEIKFHTDIKNKEKGVELAKDMLVYGCTALEWMNNTWDPFGINIKGWSEHVKLTKDNYSDVFKELYDKYKGNGRKVEPEVKLLFMVAISAGTFHASKTAAKIPGLEDVIKDNPELLAKIESTISEKFTGPPPKSAEQIQKETEYRRYQQMMAEKGKVWISVHGFGVPYTHVRISTTPKYYFDNELKKE